MKNTTTYQYHLIFLGLLVISLITACNKKEFKPSDDRTYNNNKALEIPREFGTIGQMIELEDQSILINNFKFNSQGGPQLMRLDEYGNKIDTFSFNDLNLNVSGMALTDDGRIIIGGSKVEGDDPCCCGSLPCHQQIYNNHDFFYRERAVLICMEMEPRFEICDEVFIFEEDERYNSIKNVIKGRSGDLYFLGGHTNDLNAERRVTWNGGNIFFGSIDQDLATSPILTLPQGILGSLFYIVPQLYESKVNSTLFYANDYAFYEIDYSNPGQLVTAQKIDLDTPPPPPNNDYISIGPIISDDHGIFFFRSTRGNNPVGKYETFVDRYTWNGASLGTKMIYTSDTVSHTIFTYYKAEDNTFIIAGTKAYNSNTNFKLFFQKLDANFEPMGSMQLFGDTEVVEVPRQIKPSRNGGFLITGYLKSDPSNFATSITGLFLFRTN